MGIGAIYKQLEFDNEASGDYGLYISGAGVFNAPERDVEMVTVPGRNGSLALDHGRFENIEVTYPAGVFGTDESDFADKVADIRAWLCSKKGYVRLTDDYNPNEYRLAVYKSGLEVSPAILKAGEFDLVFDCMPQRFLTSGETAETIASSGDTLTNPTRFASRPLLEVNGYGKIGINGEEVEIQNGAIGDVVLISNIQRTIAGGIINSFSLSPDYSSFNTGDTITLKGGQFRVNVSPGSYDSFSNFTRSGTAFSNATGLWTDFGFIIDEFSFNLGTAASSYAQAIFYYNNAGGGQTMTLKATISADTDGVLTFKMEIVGFSIGDDVPNQVAVKGAQLKGVSSQSVLGNPLYLDLDIGEAYKIVSDEIVSVNSGVFLGAELPELKPGANTITFDNTVTTLKIIPRWWTV